MKKIFIACIVGLFVLPGMYSTLPAQQVMVNKNGAVLRNLQDKLSDLVFVEDFGAVANDGRDDSKAFESAIAASQGRTINLREGVYIVSFSITKSDVSIAGNGAELLAADNSKPVISIGSNQYVHDIHLSNFSINGNKRTTGIFIHNTSLENGADFLVMDRLRINFCTTGVLVNGRTIWSRFTNCRFVFNDEGFTIKTALPCNLLYFANCAFNFNTRFGLWVQNDNAASETFKTFQFSSCDFEANGQQADTAYGAWFSGVESLVLENIYCENNGNSKNESYGIKITGQAGRGLSVMGGWYVGSKYPIYIDGEKKWGNIWNVTAESNLKNGKDILLYASWQNDEPKIQVQQCMAGIATRPDAQGNLPMAGVDWEPGDASTLSMQNREWLKIFADKKDKTISKITGLYPGKKIGFINYSPAGFSVIIDSNLMADGKPFIIKPNAAIQFITDGYPTPGKLIALKGD